MSSINIKVPLELSPLGAFKANKTTIEAVADDLKVLLQTNHGERPILGDFGANLRSVIFEPETGIEQPIIDLVTVAVEKWMPYVTILDIQVSTSVTNPSLAPNTIGVFIVFSVLNQQGSVNVSVRG